MIWILLTAACLTVDTAQSYLVNCGTPHCNDVCEEMGYNGRTFKTKDDAVAWLRMHPVGLMNHYTDAIDPWPTLLVDLKSGTALHVRQTEHLKTVTEKKVDGYDVELK